MEPGPKHRDDSRLLPEGAVPCVWMTAGLISWKLCDRDLECQSCPLDAALQCRSRRMDGARFREHEPAPWKFPEDRRYNPSHSWIQRVDDDRVRFGVDVSLLDR